MGSSVSEKNKLTIGARIAPILVAIPEGLGFSDTVVILSEKHFVEVWIKVQFL